MANPSDPAEPESPDTGLSESESEVVLLLATADAALRRVWRAARPPAGFRLETVDA